MQLLCECTAQRQSSIRQQPAAVSEAVLKEVAYCEHCECTGKCRMYTIFEGYPRQQLATICGSNMLLVNVEHQQRSVSVVLAAPTARTARCQSSNLFHCSTFQYTSTACSNLQFCVGLHVSIVNVHASTKMPKLHMSISYGCTVNHSKEAPSVTCSPLSEL
jgi:hypothetical protein